MGGEEEPGPMAERPSSARYEPPSINLQNRNDSHTLIVELVGTGNLVLEVGTSTGYLTRVLRDLGNRVIGIEVDGEAAKIAEDYCDLMIPGDVEEIDLDDYLAPASIDLAVFGDVLEHLRYPAAVLKKVRRYLKPHGSVVVSIPNVCHGDVLISLLNGDFRYTSMGLLDETHLRFFGLKNVFDLLTDSGYEIEEVRTTRHPVGGTELRREPEEVPAEIRRFIEGLPNADVYQFVLLARPSADPKSPPAPAADLKGILDLAVDPLLREHEEPLRREVAEAMAKSQEASERLEALKEELEMARERGQSLELAVSEREGRIAELLGEVDEAGERARSLDQVVSEGEARIAELSGAVEEANAEARSLELAASERDVKIAELSAGLEEAMAQARSLEGAVSERDGRIKGLILQLQKSENLARQLENEICEMRRSVVWQLTMKYHNAFVERGLPQGTRRRNMYNLGLKGGRIMINDGFKKAISQFYLYITQKSYKSPEINYITDNNTIFDANELEKKCYLGKKYISDLFDRASKKSSEYVPESINEITLNNSDIKLIAFYLPQYHPIPQNDTWWGKGFTDWTNVSKAVPQFVGHYQPHLPDELGFYDLRLVDVQKRQIEIAKKYGIYGFCFHYYWFNGKKLLERPLEQFLNNTDLNFKFCICWANENWTRRWDGMENEVLISQTHSPENDILFIKDLEYILKDPRYIRIEGRPVLIVYRLPLLPDAKSTSECWRNYCKDIGLGDLYLIAAQTFGFKDPREYGFDAAVEFPPHTLPGCMHPANEITVMNPLFSGDIFDYDGFVKSKKYLKREPFKLFKTVSPGWDNTARRPNNPTILYGSNPLNYKEWLIGVAEWTKEVHKPDERIIFINAWNEWAEGAHLEPDRKYGYGFLQSTAEVILDFRSRI